MRQRGQGDARSEAFIVYINQSIIGGIRWGARRLAHPTTPLPGVTTRESPCRLPSHTKQLSTGNINLPQPRALWAPPWPPPRRIVSYRYNPVGRIGFKIQPDGERVGFQGSVPHAHIAKLALTDYAGNRPRFSLTVQSLI
ncbi:hypothetical protein GWK47_005795 [Chionoecetes opilio]|uniref:Uncharacterized protein n=1 Tax=Chionoecetes opilio TaxID=41210 RepID=A0A8J4YGQ0_CHIOP|nr:hypothetical protein GWK47_005795 [Chionoecetes opilio]